MARRQHRTTPRRANADATATLATRIPKPLHRRLRLYCIERGVTAQEVVEAAIRKRLAWSRPGLGS
jgi:hypothetical protein